MARLRSRQRRGRGPKQRRRLREQQEGMRWQGSVLGNRSRSRRNHCNLDDHLLSVPIVLCFLADDRLGADEHAGRHGSIPQSHIPSWSHVCRRCCPPFQGASGYCHDSIVGPVYRYDTSRRASLSMHLTPPPLCTTPFVSIRAVLSISSLGAGLSGALLLELAVEVVALLGPGNVVAVPGNS